MANASIAVGTYAGEAARPYVAAAILSADSIANSYISVLENVHSKAVLRKFSGAAIQANDDCAFSTPSAGQLTLGEAVLTASCPPRRSGKQATSSAWTWLQTCWRKHATMLKKGNMPTSPEFCDWNRKICEVKISHEGESHQFSSTYGDIGITTEIIIDLKWIKDHCHKYSCRIIYIRLLINSSNQCPDRSCDNDLTEKPNSNLK